MIQNTLAQSTMADSASSNIPNYVRILFRNYCETHKNPSLVDIDKIQPNMSSKLQIYQPEIRKETKLNKKMIQQIFPNATSFINHQKQPITLIANDSITTAPPIEEVNKQR